MMCLYVHIGIFDESEKKWCADTMEWTQLAESHSTQYMMIRVRTSKDTTQELS